MSTEAIVPVVRSRPHDLETGTPVSDPALSVALEFLLALLLLTASIPILVVIALLVKLTSRGPVLYTQVRLGKGGRPYTLYKIRTMVVGSEKQGACWSRPGDPRVTPLGWFLRKTHLDELPQLWNILRGDMRLIGPRPERPEFIPSLAEAIPCYCDRLQVRPGITGLAQVQLPADSDLESVRMKLAYDLWYLHHRSFGLDVRIVLATALKLCSVSFPTIRALLGFPPREEVERAYQKLCDTAAATQPESGVVKPRPLPATATPALALHLMLSAHEQSLLVGDQASTRKPESAH
jgi:lipopolysaccharide/colanic/teichoic acid biosynthesis glycosyltransferase